MEYKRTTVLIRDEAMVDTTGRFAIGRSVDGTVGVWLLPSGFPIKKGMSHANQAMSLITSLIGIMDDLDQCDFSVDEWAPNEKIKTSVREAISNGTMHSDLLDAQNQRHDINRQIEKAEEELEGLNEELEEIESVIASIEKRIKAGSSKQTS